MDIAISEKLISQTIRIIRNRDRLEETLTSFFIDKVEESNALGFTIKSKIGDAQLYVVYMKSEFPTEMEEDEIKEVFENNKKKDKAVHKFSYYPNESVVPVGKIQVMYDLENEKKDYKEQDFYFMAINNILKIRQAANLGFDSIIVHAENESEYLLKHPLNQKIYELCD
jgi:hypothetical protein